MKRIIKVRYLTGVNNIPIDRAVYAKDKRVVTDAYWRYWHGHTYTDIYEAYKKPSSSKVYWWKHYTKLLNSIKAKDISIISNGCQTFSIGFIVNLVGTDNFGLITKGHNIRVMPLWEIKGSDTRLWPLGDIEK